MDTRSYRLECYKAFTAGTLEVDMAVINANNCRGRKTVTSTTAPSGVSTQNRSPLYSLLTCGRLWATAVDVAALYNIFACL
jgi:hypothetical protein